MRSRVWSWVVLAGILCVGLPVQGEDKAALAERLKKAATDSSIDDPALKPWHLKLTFQLLDKKGATTQEGTIEEWWSIRNYKRIYTSSSYTATEVKRDSKFYRTTGQTSPPYLLELLQHEVIHPIRSDFEMDKIAPELRTEPFGKVKLDCIMMDSTSKRESFPVLGTYSTYCFNRDDDKFRVSLAPGSEDITRDSIGKFQGRSVPIDTRVAVHGVPAAKAHIAVLSGITSDDKAFDTDDSQQLQEIDAVPRDFGVVGGSKISGPPPIYPQEDKNLYRSGSVHLRAVIGTDGHVHELSVLDSASPTFSTSALAAVRQWIYKPFTLNGVPCDVETTVTINYNFGPG